MNVHLTEAQNIAMRLMDGYTGLLVCSTAENKYPAGPPYVNSSTLRGLHLKGLVKIVARYPDGARFEVTELGHRYQQMQRVADALVLTGDQKGNARMSEQRGTLKWNSFRLGGTAENGTNKTGRGTRSEDARDCGRGNTDIEREADRGQVQAERNGDELSRNDAGHADEGHGEAGPGHRFDEGDSPAVQDRNLDVDRVGIRNGVDDGTGSDNENDAVADRDDEIVVCGECEQEYTRGDSPRVDAGLKCGNCAYG